MSKTIADAKEVQELLISGKSVLTGTKKDYEEIVDAQFFDNRLKELEALRDTLKTSEGLFFKKLHIYNSDLNESLEELKTRIEEWNNSGAGIMIISNDKLIKAIISIYGEGIPLKDLTEAFTNEDVLTEIFGEEIINKAQNNKIPDIKLETYFNAKNIQDLVKHEFEPKKLSTFITFTKSSNGKYSLTFAKNTSRHYRARMADLFNQVAKKKGLKVNKLEAYSPFSKKDTDNGVDPQKLLEEQIQLVIKNFVSGDAYKYISKEIDTNFESYGLTKTIGNYAVIKGFLGEVYWNAFFRFLGLGSIPTGLVKDKDKNQSITIDLILENFGFQVKAYNLKEGKVEFGSHNETRQVGTFIEDRAQIPEPVSQILFKLFTAYAYYKPLDKERNTEAYKNYVALYDDIITAVNDTNQIFQKYADRIIGLDKTFEVDDEKLPFFNAGKSLYANTFFLINKEPVPGSAILQAIIDSYETEEAKIKFFGEFSSKDKPVYRDTPVPKEDRRGANLALIKYRILLNVEEIMKAAYDNIKKLD